MATQIHLCRSHAASRDWNLSRPFLRHVDPVAADNKASTMYCTSSDESGRARSSSSPGTAAARRSAEVGDRRAGPGQCLDGREAAGRLRSSSAAEASAVVVQNPADHSRPWAASGVLSALFVLIFVMTGCQADRGASGGGDGLDVAEGQLDGGDGLSVDDGQGNDQIEDAAGLASAVASPAAGAPPVCRMIAESGDLLRVNAAVSALFSDQDTAARGALRAAAVDLELVAERTDDRRREMRNAADALRALAEVTRQEDVPLAAQPIADLGSALTDCGFEESDR